MTENILKERLLLKKLVWNVEVTAATPNSILEWILKEIVCERKGITVACANPHSQVEASKDERFLEALNHFDIILPDGVGTQWASKLLNKGMGVRFSGPEYFAAMSHIINKSDNKYTYFFLGSTDDVLDAILEKMNERYQHISVVGTYSPPFKDFSGIVDHDIIALINAANPTFLWIGMTAPKQEKWMALHSSFLTANVISAIGAEFDYFAGTKKRPPVIISKLGLQWFHRLLTEPRRTWKRHFVSMPLFVTYVLIAHIRHLFCRK